MPGAIDKGIAVCIAPNGSRQVRLFACDLKSDNAVEFNLDEDNKPAHHWSHYIYGVCKEVMKHGVDVMGFDAAFSGDVPKGSGMSSSAALECSFAFALNDMFGGNRIDKFELAKIGQTAEREYSGVNCGIMDQFSSVFGKESCLMRLDCRSLEHRYFQFKPEGYRLMLVNSGVKHSLGNEYNERRASCEQIVANINFMLGYHIDTLREADYDMLDAIREQSNPTDWMRAKYVLDEKERVLAACEALERSDYQTVGKKMYETHWGMSRLYTASCEEIDFLVNIAEECGVSGSRIMGGGFGGCSINLVKESIYPSFVSKVRHKYVQKYGINPEIYDVTIDDGSRRL